MKKKKITAFFALAFLIVVYLFNFTSLEFGDYDSIQEAVKKGVTYKDKKILSIEQMNEVTIVLFQTKLESENNSQERDVIAVAFFTGNDKLGWKKEGTDSWEWNLEANFSAYHKNYHGKKTVFTVYYGEIHNNDIHTIQMDNQSSNQFVEAKLIEKDDQRYYVNIGDIGDSVELHAFDDKGKLIEKKLR